MAFRINDVILQKTTRCMYGFQCLEGKRNLCEVSIYIEGDGLFLKKAQYAQCPYKKLGRKHSYYQCSCPTRIELYKRYKV